MYICYAYVRMLCSLQRTDAQTFFTDTPSLYEGHKIFSLFTPYPRFQYARSLSRKNRQKTELGQNIPNWVMSKLRLKL